VRIRVLSADQEADDMISIRSIRATTTFINNCISLFLLSNVRGPQYGRHGGRSKAASFTVWPSRETRNDVPTDVDAECLCRRRRQSPPTRDVDGGGKWMVGTHVFVCGKVKIFSIKKSKIPPQRTCYNIFRRRAVCSAKRR